MRWQRDKPWIYHRHKIIIRLWLLLSDYIIQLLLLFTIITTWLWDQLLPSELSSYPSSLYWDNIFGRKGILFELYIQIIVIVCWYKHLRCDISNYNFIAALKWWQNSGILCGTGNHQWADAIFLKFSQTENEHTPKAYIHNTSTKP